MKFKIGKNVIDTTDRRTQIAGAVAIVLITAGMIYLFSSHESPDANIAVVARGEFYRDIYESGEVRAVNSIDMNAPREWSMDLQITDMIEEGTIVSEGDTLVKFDTSQLQEQLAQAIDELKAQEAEVLSSEAQQKSEMSTLQSDLVMAQYSLEATELELEQLKYESKSRQEEARLSHEIEKISFDETETKISSQGIINKAEMSSVLQALHYRQFRVKDLNERIDAMTLVAPRSGMVVYNEIGGHGQPRHKVTMGETIRPGVTVVSIPDLSEMECVLRVNEIDASKIRSGQQVTMQLDAYMNHLFTGTVKRVAPLADKADNESQLKDFEVLVKIDQSNQLLKPGMTAKTRLVIETIPNVLAVPIGAVYEDEGKPVVFTSSSFPNPVPVKLGERNDQHIIITDGIKEGDRIYRDIELDQYNALGWYENKQRKEKEKQVLLGHIGEMEELGVGEDVPKTSTPAEQPSGNPTERSGGQGAPNRR